VTAIRIPSGHAGSRILGVGAFRPERVVPNSDIVGLIDSSDEWIRERSGIIERRYAAADQSVVDMATEAAGKALANSGVSAESVDIVLVATISHPYQIPSAAAIVADRLGMKDPGAMDLGAACAGFCYGLATADSMIRSGTAHYVLVVGAEKLSDITDPTDRGTAFIFADGAGAVVVGPSETPGIGPVVWGSDGSQHDVITMTQSWVEYALNPADKAPAMSMQGQVVYRWAIGNMADACRRALDAAGLTVDDLDAFVPHQANMRITDALVRALKLPSTVAIARDISTTGNTSAASIPLALDQLIGSGSVNSGDTALMVGFGAGLTYAAQVVTLP
jgi:3-oxoacyl-[acyl-carrier-protein] synthase-3